ncbi:glycosyltransferase family 2 protein [Flavobacterium sp. GT3P67]|uniref:glycosyltransferase family 2 protein n=1 Tax=Flavobacterium sp. GT3P67 TaxID=2541722 RepID=UPI001043DAF8|nr:glycosyltransferase [Flavobacterium sp. GT3P67]TDE51302.1 glycosyltransferase [Flavobacterium sp. GT3P67]
MKKSGDLISIVVPVYKVEAYLSRCIDSILSQTHKNFELILINDGSPDNCPQICDAYASEHSCIKVIHKKNEGVSIARNKGIEITKGKYIAFVDSDDYIHKDYLSTLMFMLSNSEAQLSMCAYKRVFDSEIDEIKVNTDFETISDLVAMDMLLNDQSKCSPWGKLYDIDLFKEVKFPEGKLMEDMFIMPTLFSKAKIVAINSQELYYYNQEGLSITRSSFNYKKLDIVEGSLSWKNHTELNYPTLFEKASMHYYATVIDNCIYLSKVKDDYGISIYKKYKKEIKSNYSNILKSKYSSKRTKIKVVLLKYGLFRLFFKLY